MTPTTFVDAIFTPLMVIALAYLLYRGVRGILWYRAAHRTRALVWSALASGIVAWSIYFTVALYH